MSKRATRGQVRALRAAIARLVRLGAVRTNLDRHGWVGIIDRRDRSRS
jgi:predicted DNA-binding transcriptional regulator